VREVTLAIEGMTCEACTSHIKSELARVPGVQSARVQYREKRAVVSYDSSRTSADRLQRAVEAAGYRSSRLPAGTQQK